MAKYSEESQEKVKEAMEEMKAGKLKTGTGKKVTNPKQAIAIGLSEAREEGAKVPPPPTKKSGKAPSNKAATKKAAPKKSAKKALPKKAAKKKKE
jgi:hypothetical protein